MAKDLKVNRDLLFKLAAKEGGWRKEDLDHNIPLKNPFGVQKIVNRKAVGNKGYSSINDAITEWENSSAGTRVRRISDEEQFINALQHPAPPALPYNDVSKAIYDQDFRDIDIAKWKDRCGITD